MASLDRGRKQRGGYGSGAGRWRGHRLGLGFYSPSAMVRKGMVRPTDNDDLGRPRSGDVFIRGTG
jgi:hypothetical protein